MKKLFLFLLSLSFITLLGVGRVEAATEDELVAWWRLDQNLEDSALDNDGSSLHVPLYYEGKINYAADFNGSTNYIEVEDHDSLDMPEEITIEAWIFPDSLSQYRTIVAKRLSSEANYAFRIWEGKLEFYYRSSGDLAWSEWSTTGVVIKTGVWQHVAVSYVFGEEELDMFVGSTPVTGGWIQGAPIVVSLTTTYDLYIGGISPNAQLFDGLIDNVKIWTKALPIEDIYDTDLDGVVDSKDFCDSPGGYDAYGESGGYEIDYFNSLEFVEWGQNRWLYTPEGWLQKFTKKGKTSYIFGDSLEDTLGCTCSDMLTELNKLGEFTGHWKYGCSSSILEHFVEDAEDGEIDGYNFNHHMESINVYAKENGDSTLPVTSSNPLMVGKKYLLRASGTAEAGDTIEFDAKYSVKTNHI